MIDKRNEIYKKTPEREFFKGRGNRLGSTFEGKPASMIFLEPMKGTKLHGSAITFNNSTSHKTSLKKFQKKRSRSACFQVSLEFSIVASHKNCQIKVKFLFLGRTKKSL